MINPNQLGPYYMDCIGMCGLHNIHVPWTGKLFIHYLHNTYIQYVHAFPCNALGLYILD